MYKVENVAITRIKEYENNPRNNDVAVDKVAASIKRFGFLFPIVIDINYVIVCGHTRKKACESLGIKSVPCIKIDDLTPEQINYFRLVDNRSSEYASWDFAKLESELKQINLDVVENYLLLETFDLDTNLVDLNEEMDDIKVESFNFLSPINSNNASNDNEDLDNTEYAEKEYNTDSKEYEGSTSIVSESGAQGLNSNDVSVQVDDEALNSKPKVPTLFLFELGKIRFCISKVELDLLNSAYVKYLDTVYPQKSFIDFLLEGLPND